MPRETIYAVQHIRRMRGGSQAHLLRASDSNFYVVKFQNTPQHNRVLANEYLGSRLGSLLGLPMPEVHPIDVPESLIVKTPGLCLDSAGLSIPCKPGLALASHFVADYFHHRIFDYLPESMFAKVINGQDFARVLVFDKWTANCDGRQAVFAKPDKERLYRAFFIDQGHCFNGGAWTFSDLALQGVYYRNHVYQTVTGWQSFEPTISGVERFDISDLWKAAEGLPPQWYEHDSEGLMGLINALHERRPAVRDLINLFRSSSRNPFPAWTSS